MGIDAKILLRLKGGEPSDAQIAEWAWDLARAVGADKFFLQDGLPKAAYKVALEKWLKAFDAHPKAPTFRLERDYDVRDALHKQILADIGEVPEELNRALELSDAYEDGIDGKIFHQDGDPILAANDEWFLTVNLWSRYYGIGYERGDLMTICAIAEWAEANIPNCEVWYGGDSSGVLAEKFDAAAREALKRHFYSPSGRDYFGGWAKQGSFPTPAPCGLCIPKEPRFNQHGFGQNFIAVNCGGCGKSFESRDNGKTWTTVKED